jgi:diphosphomevalonate decarboxylase
MNKVKIKSPANIAFIKYWGQKDKKLFLPYNDSFSMNLSSCYTILEIEKKEDPKIQKLYIKDYEKDNFKMKTDDSFKKVLTFYHQAKKFLKVKKDYGFVIYSYNSFPKKAGIASSASFFSALALGFSWLFEKKLDKKNLSILARLSGSGSSCRSIPDGFSWWYKGKKSSDSYAISIAPPSYWDLVDLVLILNKKEKKVSSLEGHLMAETSGLFKYRLLSLEKRLKEIKKAFFKKDFTYFGYLLEEETISMHSVMMTQKPPLFYWSGKTVEVIKKIIEQRKKGVEGYFTIDAGENIHLICQKKDEEKFLNFLKKQKEVLQIIKNYPTYGTKFI